MRKYYDQANSRLVFEGAPADSAYWDSLWDGISDFEHLVARGATDPLIRTITPQYLPPRPDVRILEGGCGIGHHVAGLQQLGYDAVGVDYAARTVAKINQLFPELKVQQADVRSLPFPDNSFDGYWSLGVIEHFFDGYEVIAEEMYRVLKPGGYLFLTFPHLSALRRWKIQHNKYPAFNRATFSTERFYQFGLDENAVAAAFTALGFKLRKKQRINGLKGFKDEVPHVKPALQYMYDSRLFPLRVAKVVLSEALTPVASHSILLVLQKA
jgi:SAM-dependent methyltransferase